jgi:hypothetical protein
MQRTFFSILTAACLSPPQTSCSVFDSRTNKWGFEAPHTTQTTTLPLGLPARPSHLCVCVLEILTAAFLCSNSEPSLVFDSRNNKWGFEAPHTTQTTTLPLGLPARPSHLWCLRSRDSHCCLFVIQFGTFFSFRFTHQ